jgi:Flp pilus assembly protein TadD
MSNSITFRIIRRVNVYRKSIVAVAIVAITIGFSAACRKDCIAGSNEALEVEALSKQIKDVVKGLEYSDKVATDFVQMAIGWNDKQGKPVLVVWKSKLAKAKQECELGKISMTQLAEIEKHIIIKLSQRSRQEFPFDRAAEFFDLADVIKHRQAQCVGYSQLFYVLGTAVGLRTEAINVLKLSTGRLADHVACIVSLADGGAVMIDLTRFVSKRFLIEEEFTQIGNYLDLKDGKVPVRIHKTFQMLDRNGLLAVIHLKRGTAHYKSGDFSMAIREYTEAVELNPEYAEAYASIGTAYAQLGRPAKAISYLDKAIQRNPRYSMAYVNRGYVYTVLGRLTEALSDFNRAIQLNHRNAAAYTYRGITYTKLKQHSQAFSDFTRAIELDPNYPKPYAARGVLYASIGESERARSSIRKAIELDPALKVYARNISDRFNLDLKLD